MPKGRVISSRLRTPCAIPEAILWAQFAGVGGHVTAGIGNQRQPVTRIVGVGGRAAAVHHGRPIAHIVIGISRSVSAAAAALLDGQLVGVIVRPGAHITAVLSYGLPVAGVIVGVGKLLDDRSLRSPRLRAVLQQ